MSFEQYAILGILLAMLATYATERFRVELVAMAGLVAGFLTGVVPAQSVFRGFSSSAVITVAEVLLIVSALSSSRAVDNFARRIVSKVRSETGVLAILCCTGAFVSIFMNNIGALALMFPVTLSACARLNVAPGRMLMPLSFAILLTGTCSLTGTPANLIVNQWIISETGRGMGYFELALLGGPIAIAGLAWLLFSAPRAFRHMKPTETPFDSGPADFISEMLVKTGSGFAGLPLPDAEARYGITIHGVLRNNAHVFARRSDIVLASDDVLLVEGTLANLDQLRSEGELDLSDARGFAGSANRIEAVVMPDSLAIGSRVGDILSFIERDVQVVGIASRKRRIEGRFEELLVGMGDVLILSGEREALREAVADCGLLQLSARRPAPPRTRAATNVAIFAAGVLLTAFNLAPPEIAFGAVVIGMVMVGSLDLRSALPDLNWSILLLLACMIPLGMAVQETGVAQIIANAITGHLPSTTPLAVAIAVLLMAVAITPFIDNVSTAVVLSPIAAGMAASTGVPVQPVLMAVAIGASLDFLTPFGHHNNTVVMGAAGYRFLDFPRFGVPLLAICIITAVAVLTWGF